MTLPVVSSVASEPLMLVRRWGPKVGFSIIDQGAVSGANLALSVLLARWLSNEEYGAFAVTLSVFLILAGFHNALILEPMSVLGPSRYADRLPSYIHSLTRLHLGLSLALSLSAVALTFVLKDQSLTKAVSALALTIPLLLLFWLLRRAHYVRSAPAMAAVSSLAYMLTLLSGAWGLYRLNSLSASSALLLMAAASLAASGVAWIMFAPGRSFGAHASTSHVAVAVDHWHYGRWIAVASILSLAASQVQILAAASMSGLEAAAILRAMQVPSLLMVQLVTAVAVLGLPILSREYYTNGPSRLRGMGMRMIAGLVAAAVGYELLLVVLGGRLERLLYGGKFADSAWLIAVLGLVPVFLAFTTGCSLVLRAAHRPEHFLVYSGAMAIAGIPSAVLLTSLLGVVGAAVSAVAAYAAAAAVTYYLLQAWIPRR